MNKLSQPSMQADYAPPLSNIDGGIRLILCHSHVWSRNERRENPIRSGIPFKKKTFDLIMKSLKLPPSYLEARYRGKGAGTYARFISHDEDNNVNRIGKLSWWEFGILACLISPYTGFIFENPYVLRHTSVGLWSVAISYDTQTKVTTGIFDGISEEESKELELFLASAPAARISHPLSLFAILLELESIRSNHNRWKFDDWLYQLECQTGVSRDPNDKYSDAKGIDHSRLTSEYGRCAISLTYLDRRLNFGSGFARFLLENLEQLPTILPQMEPNRPCHDIKESIGNYYNLANNQIHHCQCLLRRVDWQMNVLYSLIAQRDNRINLEIAASNKQDGFAMKTISIMTIVFLPGTFISSFFSMSMFDWQAETVISSRFWIYWIITIPLTVIVLAVWTIWMKWNARDPKKSMTFSIDEV